MKLYLFIYFLVWYAGPDGVRDADPYVQRQWAAATFLNKEFGVIESGLTGGNGDFSLVAFFDYVDRVHNAGIFLSFIFI